MLGVAIYGERALALQLNLTLAVNTAGLRAVGTVGQRVLGTLLGTDLYTLLVGNIDDGTTGVGQCQASQGDGTFIGT